MLLVPLAERSGINLDNSILDNCLGSHKLVVAGVVHDIQHTGLVGVHWNQARHKPIRSTLRSNTDVQCILFNTFRSPGEVASFQTQSSELQVASTPTNNVYALWSKLGVSRLAASFEGALLSVGRALSTSCSALVP